MSEDWFWFQGSMSEEMSEDWFIKAGKGVQDVNLTNNQSYSNTSVNLHPHREANTLEIRFHEAPSEQNKNDPIPTDYA